MSTKRRGNREGSISKEPSRGGYVGKVRVLDPVTGASRRVTVRGKTSSEVRRKLRAVVDRADQGRAVVDSSLTVKAYLERWQDVGLPARGLGRSTVMGYGYAIEKQLIPFLGELKLKQLKPSDVERFVVAMKRGEVGERKTPYAASTIRTAYTVLRMALSDAVRDGYLARNPAAEVSRPKPSDAEARVLTPEETRRLLEAAKGHRLYSWLILVGSLGLRKGESLALRWENVDLEVGTVKVTETLGRYKDEAGKWRLSPGPPKAGSKRTLDLSSSPALLELLRRHRIAQAEERLRAGSAWQEHGLVFPSELGTYVDPRNALRALKGWAAKAGLDEAVTVHTLRHTSATAQLDAGLSPKVVADVLGHSDARVTLSTYAHALDPAKAQAVKASAALFGAV